MSEIMVRFDDLRRYCEKRHCGSVPLEYIKQMPTIEAEHVRRGRWIEHGGGIVATCSYCNASYNKDVLQSISPYAEHLTRYCPNCGARMDGGADNDSE